MTTNKDVYREVCEQAATITFKDIKAHVVMLTTAMVALSYEQRTARKEIETLRGENAALRKLVYERLGKR